MTNSGRALIIFRPMTDMMETALYSVNESVNMDPAHTVFASVVLVTLLPPPLRSSTVRRNTNVFISP